MPAAGRWGGALFGRVGVVSELRWWRGGLVPLAVWSSLAMAGALLCDA